VPQCTVFVRRFCSPPFCSSRCRHSLPLNPPLSLEALFSAIRSVARQKISPDGTLFAYLAPDQGVLNVWVRTLGKTDHRVVTNDRKRRIRNFVWQYDSKNILYAQDKDGDENWHVYQTNLDLSG
jgi:hypothetical protein